MVFKANISACSYILIKHSAQSEHHVESVKPGGT